MTTQQKDQKLISWPIFIFIPLMAIWIGGVYANMACAPSYADRGDAPKAGLLSRTVSDEYVKQPPRWEHEMQGAEVKFKGRGRQIMHDGMVMFEHGPLLRQAPLTCEFAEAQETLEIQRQQKLTVAGKLTTCGRTRATAARCTSPTAVGKCRQRHRSALPAGPCCQRPMMFDNVVARNRHLLIERSVPSLGGETQSGEWRVRVGHGKGKALAHFLNYATPDVVRKFNELPGHGATPAEPFICG